MNLRPVPRMTLRAALLLIALTGLFRWRSGRDRPVAAFLAAMCLAVLLSGCAARETPAPPPPIVLGAVLCPEPAAPALPPVDGGESFDTLDQYDVFMERDDLMRGHINALRRTVHCYRAQVK